MVKRKSKSTDPSPQSKLRITFLCDSELKKFLTEKGKQVGSISSFIRGLVLLHKEGKFTFTEIEDEGRTEFKGIPTKTCIAIGPNKAKEIDKITGHLPLR